MTIYLDANAREPLRPEAAATLAAAAALPGNPASVHGPGRAARRVLEDARDAIAARQGLAPEQVVFTSGATEALALALHGFAPDRRVMIGATEHDAVRAAAPSDAAVCACDAEGVADLAALERWLRAEARPALVCLMAANNETGVLQPIEAAAALCAAHGALLVVDAVQVAGRTAQALGAWGAAACALSSAKLGGPPGAGALLLGPDTPWLAPLIAGGGQERGRRGGTPPLPAIAGMAAAMTASSPVRHDLPILRDAIDAAAQAAGATVLGHGAARLGNTTCLALPDVSAATQVMALDLAGFAVSAGAACSSGKVAASHVLRAMGAGALAGTAIRVSLPWTVQPAEVMAFADAYTAMAGHWLARRRSA